MNKQKNKQTNEHPNNIMNKTILDKILKNDFPAFIGKTLATADPAAHFQSNWHIDLIAEHLEAARRGEITRLIINMPPRALKSQCVSIAWPAWILGHDPSARIMAASYSAALAIRHSLDCRQVITSDWYQRLFPATKLTRDQNEKRKFMTTARGFRFATSVGGIWVCPRTHHGMSRYPCGCALSPITVCPPTHLGPPLHPSRCAHAPILVCACTHHGWFTAPCGCALVPMLVCACTHDGAPTHP